ncbi:hypothetical protein LNP74_30780 [Klebsiella pneumoniae subsp. pneumoniae]|nr:hypothetical protein [Klebsiella pneumoniae subsp. pneumoniae]
MGSEVTLAHSARRVGGNIAVRDRIAAPVCRQGAFCVLAEERRDEPASRAGITRIPL